MMNRMMGERMDNVPGFFPRHQAGMQPGVFAGRGNPTVKEEVMEGKGSAAGDGCGGMEQFSSFDDKSAGILGQSSFLAGNAFGNGAGVFSGGGDDGEMFLGEDSSLDMGHLRSRSDTDAKATGTSGAANEPETSRARAQGTLRVAVGTRKKSLRRSKSFEAIAGAGKKSKDGKKKKADVDADEDDDDYDDGEVTPKKTRAAEEAQKRLEVVDPKRAKRILANRQSAARSKERKLRYISELEERVTLLQKEASGLSNQVRSLQQENQGYNQENMHLRHRLTCAEEQAKIRDALHLALKDEVGRLQLPGSCGSAYDMSEKLLQATGSDMSRMPPKDGMRGSDSGMGMTGQQQQQMLGGGDSGMGMTGQQQQQQLMGHMNMMGLDMGGMQSYPMGMQGMGSPEDSSLFQR